VGAPPSTKNPKFWNGDIPWIRSVHLAGYYIDSSSVEHYITKEGLENSAANIVPKDNIIVATRVGIGKSAVNLIDVAINQDLTRIVLDKTKVNPFFVVWFLHSPNVIKILESFSRDTTIKGVPQNYLKNLWIPLPPITEQQKIAEILSNVDEAIQKTDEIIAKVERLKKGLMQELLTKGIGYTEFKEIEIGKIPKEWKVVNVFDLFSIETGTTPSTKKKEYWENGTINWFTPTDLSKLNGKIFLEDSERKITSIALKEPNLTIIPKGSILISTRAPVGYVAVLKREGTFNQGCKGLVPKKCNEMSSEFYCYYFISIKKKLENLSGGSTFRELSKAMLEKIKIPLPPLQEQQKIAEILLTVDKKLEIERRRRERLERIKGLMDLLLTGKIRVRVS